MKSWIVLLLVANLAPAAKAQSCTLCANGASPIDSTLVINNEGLTCGGYDANVRLTNSTDSECAEIQKSGILLKCCAPPAGNCKMCPNGDSGFMKDMAVDGSTCGDLALTASTYLSSSTECADYQRIGISCGCTPPKGSCTLCRGGSAPKSPNNIADTANKTCRQYEQLAKLVSKNDPQCRNIRNTGIRKCDCEVPAGRCSMCGNESYDATKTFGGTNCRDYDLYLKTVTATSAVCQQKDVDFGYRCGCPIPAGNCYLCPDRAAPPNPSQVVGTNGETCRQFARRARFVKRGTAACSNFRRIGVANCGCRPRSNTCRLCSDRKDPPNPNLKVGDSTCGAQAAYYSALPITNRQCTSEAKIATGNFCCKPL